MKLGCSFFKSWRQIPFVRACGSCKSSNRSLSYFGRRGGNLENVNQDVDKIAQVLDQANSIVVMAGAGLSTASGIPDFRSPNSGIYANLKQYELPYPEAIFDIEYFRQNPRPFNTWAKEFFPGENYLPNKGHYFLKVLDRKGKLSKYFTQNIDGLERLAGLSESKIVEAHGTFAHAKCIRCEEKVNMEEFREKIRCDQDPTCRNCGGWVKPSIVFFGEALPPRFFDEAEIDCEFCDQLICIGTSLEVYPFAGIVDAPKHKTPRLLINYDLVGSFGARPNDAAMIGDIVMNIDRLCNILEWTDDLLEAQIENELF